MKNQLVRCLSVFLMVSVASCGTAPVTSRSAGVNMREAAEDRHQPPAGARIGLSLAPPHPSFRIVEPARKASKARTKTASAPSYSFGQNLKFDTAAVFCVIFYPCIVGVALTAAAVKGGIEVADAASEQAVEVALEAAKTAAGPLDESFSSLAPLAERVSAYARETGLTQLVNVPAGATPHTSPEQARAYGGVEYLFELDPLEVKPARVRSFAADSNLFRFRMSAQGRLVRLSDHSVADEFVTVAVTADKDISPTKRENEKLLVAELDKALDQLARQLVDEWIRPVLLREPARRQGTGTADPFPGERPQCPTDTAFPLPTNRDFCH